VQLDGAPSLALECQFNLFITSAGRFLSKRIQVRTDSTSAQLSGSDRPVVGAASGHGDVDRYLALKFSFGDWAFRAIEILVAARLPARRKIFSSPQVPAITSNKESPAAAAPFLGAFRF